MKEYCGLLVCKHKKIPKEIPRVFRIKYNLFAFSTEMSLEIKLSLLLISSVLISKISLIIYPALIMSKTDNSSVENWKLPNLCEILYAEKKTNSKVIKM